MRKVVAIIGDSRCDKGSFEYKIAYETGKILIDNGYRIQSGGMNGVMEAAFEGAHTSSKYREGDTIAIIPSFDSLSPSLLLIASTNASKSIPPFLAASTVSKSAMSWKMVGFLESNPKDCIAALSSLGSIFPVPFVSKRSNA